MSTHLAISTYPHPTDLWLTLWCGNLAGSAPPLGQQHKSLRTARTRVHFQIPTNRLRQRFSDNATPFAADDHDSESVLVRSTTDAPIVLVCGQCCRPAWSSWTTGFGLGGNATTDGNASGVDFTMGGTLFGWKATDNCQLLGFYGGYVYNCIGTNANESNKLNGGTFGSYYPRRLDSGYIFAAGGFEFDSYESRRVIQFANLTADGKSDGWKGYSYLGRATTFGSRRFALQPFGGLQYVYVRQNGGAANLAVSGIDTHSFRGVLGTRAFGQSLHRFGHSIRPEVRALWLHEFLEIDSSVN